MTTTAQAPPAKKRRGRESAGDMVRSLGLVLLGVLVIWYLAQPPDSDEQALRVIDPSPELRAFTADVPATPVPGPLPAQWRPNVAKRDGSSLLRVGFVTPAGAYAEYAASTVAPEEFVPDITGVPGRSAESVDIEGVSWQQYRAEDGSLSLVHDFGPVTVVAGTTRGTASLEELRVLVGSLATR